jgi:predicted nucleic acid-binding protein
MAFTVLYDASVLYPAPLRDLLMHLAATDLFRARWTRAIHDEWIRAVLERRPDLTAERLQRTRKLMDAAVLDCIVEGYEDLIPGLSLPDPGDRHVLAAAIRARANMIVTRNLRHFPKAVLEPYRIEAQHPDAFVCYLIHLAPQTVCEAVRSHRQHLKKPPKNVEEYLETLTRQSLAETVTVLRSLADRI